MRRGIHPIVRRDEGVVAMRLVGPKGRRGPVNGGDERRHRARGTLWRTVLRTAVRLTVMVVAIVVRRYGPCCVLIVAQFMGRLRWTCID